MVNTTLFPVGPHPSTERAQTALTWCSDENRCITVDMVESVQNTSRMKFEGGKGMGREIEGVARMVERLLCMQKAQGSIPCSSTFF